MRGAVKESAVLPAFFQITLGFEDLHHGHDRGVSDFAALKEDFIDITDGRSAALPDELHDFELLRGKRVVFGTHSKYLVLINSYVKEIAKRTPKQSTLPVPPVIPPGEPRGGLLFPLLYDLISTKYLLCVPNTTRLPLRSSKS